MRFCHLRTRGEHSLLNSVVRFSDFENFIQNSIQTPIAIGLLDDMSLSGGLSFGETLKNTETKSIIGANIFIKEDNYPNDQYLPSIGLLVMNEEGYINLMKLLYLSFDNEKNILAQRSLTIENLKKYSSGLICITGGINGVIPFELDRFGEDKTMDTIMQLKKIYKNRIYIELTRTRIKNEQKYENFHIKLAYNLNIPLVATNDVHFTKKNQFDAYDAITCIRDKTFIFNYNRRTLTNEFYLKNEEEMLKLFEDIPEAIINTIKISNKCNFYVKKHPPLLPKFDIIDHKTEFETIRDLSYSGLQNRLEDRNKIFEINNITNQENKNYKPEKKIDLKEYENRLEYELNVINNMGFIGYFLIVSDFMKWSKKQNIAVGPGRGSGAGSLVAWCLEITDIDPLHYGLLFERFLNPDRISMPDFDIDFCQERREEVVEYVKQKYGNEKVAHIITYGKLQAKAVLKDVGRVLGLPYTNVDRISKLIPFNPLAPVTIEQAINMDQELQKAIEEDPEITQLIDIAKQLEGLNRHTSVHAAGVIIADRNIIELAPLHKDDETGLNIIAYNMKDTEKIGLVKFDFLGLKTLTVISKTCQLIKKINNIEININQIPTKDQKTFELLASGYLNGIFQFESSVPTSALAKIKTDNILDMAAINALNRPGPMEHVPSYIRRKLGDEQINYYYEPLRELLLETCGIIIYQEQVMESARILAGYTVAEADLLRRAMGKKIISEMEQQRNIFVDKAIKVGILNQSQANEMFDILDKFSGYGFNKSHAVSYSVIAYHTAYLKAHFPVAFITIMLNLDIDVTDKINSFISEAKRMSIEIICPNINLSNVEFICNDNQIIYPLTALKGIGEKVATNIINERKINGKFTNIFDFLKRCCEIINKKTIENLAKSGAFKTFGFNIRTIVSNIEKMVEISTEFKKNLHQESSRSLFGDNEILNTKYNNFITLEEFSTIEQLQNEFEAIGFYLSKHPLEEYTKILKQFNILNSQQLNQSEFEGEQKFFMAGAITNVIHRVKKDTRWAFVHLSDLYETFETMLFNDKVIIEKQEILKEGQTVILVVNVRMNKDNGKRINILDIYTIEDFISKKELAQTLKKKFNISNYTNKKIKNTIESLNTNIEIKPKIPTHKIKIETANDILNIKEQIENNKLFGDIILQINDTEFKISNHDK